MIYAMKKDALKALAGREVVGRFYGAEMLLALFRTDPAVVREVLPKPLKPAPEPLAMAFVANYPRTNFGPPYYEGALFVVASYKGELGGYCLSMPVTNDTALIAGREQFGFPKKIAEEITLDHGDDHVTGSVTRKGVKILEIDCDLEEPLLFSDMEDYGTAVDDLDGQPGLSMVSFLFKYFPSPTMMGFDYMPRLVRQVSLFRPRPGGMKGPGEVKLVSSELDSLGEVPVREVLNIGYSVWDNVMLPGRVVGRAWNLASFLPHALFKSDYLFHSTEKNPPPPIGLKERVRQWRRMKSY